MEARVSHKIRAEPVIFSSEITISRLFFPSKKKTSCTSFYTVPLGPSTCAVLLSKHCHCCTSFYFPVHFSCKATQSCWLPGLFCRTNRRSIALRALLRAAKQCEGWLVSRAALPPGNAVLPILVPWKWAVTAQDDGGLKLCQASMHPPDLEVTLALHPPGLALCLGSRSDVPRGQTVAWLSVCSQSLNAPVRALFFVKLPSILLVRSLSPGCDLSERPPGVLLCSLTNWSPQEGDVHHGHKCAAGWIHCSMSYWELPKLCRCHDSLCIFFSGLWFINSGIKLIAPSDKGHVRASPRVS